MMAHTHTLIHINGTEVKRVISIKFLCVHISETLNTSTLVKRLTSVSSSFLATVTDSPSPTHLDTALLSTI